MSVTSQAYSETAIESPKAQRADMKLEVAVIRVSDVDRQALLRQPGLEA